MKVKECMCNEVYFAKPETTVTDIAKLMNNNHVGCIPICDDKNTIVGIVTDRDIVLRSVACDKDLKTTPASAIMSTNVYTCDCEEDISKAENIMAKNQVRRIPVIENNRVIGMLSIGDLTLNSRQLGKTNVCSTLEEICECGNDSKNDY